ncbi:MAG: hypothetical protein IKK75_00935 [Clostridia bacterium]|nr:hypothetical protein [Clostridia bacterium]
MIWLILLPLVAAALFFTWVLCRASSLAEADDERAFQEWLQRKDVNSHEGT